MKHIIFLSGIWQEISSLSTNYTRPIACYQLKHWLSKFGFNSQVIEFCQLLTADEIIKCLEHFISKETLAVAFTTSFWTPGKVPNNINQLIPLIRDKWPSLKIISGGARTIKSDIFDVCFTGESEDKLLVWCQEQVEKKGLSLFNKKFDITKLDHRFDKSDAILDNEALPIELGRGCIFKCKFCAHHNLGKPKYTYQRDFKEILSEIEYNKEHFNTTDYLLLDDTVNEDFDKIKNLSTLKNVLNFSINWTGYLRADLVWSNKESIHLLQESGLKSCFFGIETFNQKAGNSIGKGWSARYGKEFLPELYNLWNKSINIHVNLIAGLPYESINDLHNTLAWCKNNPIGSHKFVPLALYTELNDPFASSEFTRNYKDYGYKNVLNGYWENDYTNSKEATEFCRSANIELNKINKISTWDIFSAKNLGYKTEEVLNWSHGKFIAEIIKSNKNFKKKYLDKLLSL